MSGMERLSMARYGAVMSGVVNDFCGKGRVMCGSARRGAIMYGFVW